MYTKYVDERRKNLWLDLGSLKPVAIRYSQLNICDWIYGNHSKSHIEIYEIINFKDLKAL